MCCTDGPEAGLLYAGRLVVPVYVQTHQQQGDQWLQHTLLQATKSPGHGGPAELRADGPVPVLQFANLYCGF